MEVMLFVDEYKPCKGDFIKIRLNGERFWVIIAQITRNKIYVFVNNHVINQPFKCGDFLSIDKSDINDSVIISRWIETTNANTE